MSFDAIAKRRLLSSVEPGLGALRWDVEGDVYLRIPAPDDVEGILELMVRRGLEPALVKRLLELFPARPVERALIAWDVARGSLLGPEDGELAQRLSRELAAIRGLGPVATAPAIPRDRVSGLIEAVRVPGDPPSLMDDFAATPSLAALVTLTAIRDRLDDEDGFVTAVIAHASRLALAHLPSLALAFLQILWDRLAVQSARVLLEELALDHELVDAIPVMPEEDDLSVQRQAYVGVRAKLATYDVVHASVVLAVLGEIPAVRTSRDPSLLLAKAELAALKNQRLDDASVQLIESIAPPDSGWRYAAYVRDAVILQRAPHLAASLVEGWIPRFGNSVRLWRRAGRHAAARAELLELLSREVRYVSHEPEVWRALSYFAEDGHALDDEVQRRLTSQLQTALS
jgi:hypothetical protein